MTGKCIKKGCSSIDRLNTKAVITMLAQEEVGIISTVSDVGHTYKLYSGRVRLIQKDRYSRIGGQAGL